MFAATRFYGRPDDLTVENSDEKSTAGSPGFRVVL